MRLGPKPAFAKIQNPKETEGQRRAPPLIKKIYGPNFWNPDCCHPRPTDVGGR